jgi:hypothetical protein
MTERRAALSARVPADQAGHEVRSDCVIRMLLIRDVVQTDTGGTRSLPEAAAGSTLR